MPDRRGRPAGPRHRIGGDRRLTTIVLGMYPEVNSILSVPQHGNRASCRALEQPQADDSI